MKNYIEKHKNLMFSTKDDPIYQELNRLLPKIAGKITTEETKISIFLDYEWGANMTADGSPLAILKLFNNSGNISIELDYSKTLLSLFAKLEPLNNSILEDLEKKDVAFNSYLDNVIYNFNDGTIIYRLSQVLKLRVY